MSSLENLKPCVVTTKEYLKNVAEKYFKDTYGHSVELDITFDKGENYGLVQDVVFINIDNFESLPEEVQINISNNLEYEPNDIYFGFNVMHKLANYENLRKLNKDELLIEGL